MIQNILTTKFNVYICEVGNVNEEWTCICFNYVLYM